MSEDAKQRLQLIADALRDANVDCLSLVYGTSRAEELENKADATQIWLLDFTATNMALFVKSDGSCVVYAGQKTIDSAKVLGDTVRFIVRNKDQDQRGINETLEALKLSDSATLGTLPKSRGEGPFVDAMEKSLQKFAHQQDAAALLSPLLASRSPRDEKTLRLGASIADFCNQQIFRFLDNKFAKGTKLTHADAAAYMAGKWNREDGKNFWSRYSGDADLTLSEESCPVIVQSSKSGFELKPSAESEQSNINKSLILLTNGLKYKHLNLSVGRTWLINPKPVHERYYSILLRLQQHLLDLIKPGVVFSDIYNAARAFVDQEEEGLSSHLPRNLGWGSGLEYKDPVYTVNGKCSLPVVQNAVIILLLGFVGQTADKDYALLLQDTILVKDDGAIVLTQAPTSLEDITHKASNADGPDPKVGTDAILPGGRTRSKRVTEEPIDVRIAAHQDQLKADRHRAGLERFADAEKEEDEGPKFKKYESYKRDTQIPDKAASLRITLDARNKSIILPVLGMASCFHINSIKNVTKSVEGEQAVLRFNFVAPGQISGRKDDVAFENPDASFIRTMTFRSHDRNTFTALEEDITNMKKLAIKEEAERKQTVDMTDVERVVTSGARLHRLDGIILKNTGLEGKKGSGAIEIEPNGIRYRGSNKSTDHVLEIPFSNMKHFFFQPCDHELVAILHFSLRQPMMVGKRKAQDIQFYREANDLSFDETSGRNKKRVTAGDEDEVEEERRDQERRTFLNREFKSFADRIQQASERAESPVMVDIPFRELGFNGITSSKANVLLQPSTECLIQLIEFPVTVVTLAEVECAHLERVNFNLRHFDLVFIFNDFKKTPLLIGSISAQSMDSVKEWLDSVDIPITSGPVNLNWPTILKTIREEPLKFYETGGWGFLEDKAASDQDSISDEESEYVEDDSDEEADDDDSSEYDESASDESSFDEEDDEDEEDDWSEQEAAAKAADERRREKHKK